MRALFLVVILFVFGHQGFSQKYLLEKDVNMDTVLPKVGLHRKFDLANYIGVGWAAGPETGKPPSAIRYPRSWQFREGIWFRMKMTRRYAVGMYLEYARDCYNLQTPIFGDTLPNASTKWTRQINNNISLGIFNRVNLKSDRLYLDVGAYYSFDFMPRIQTKVRPLDADYDYKKTTYNKPEIMNRHNYGLDCRLNFNSLALYTKYRLSGLYKKNDYDLPKMMFGLIVDLRG